jgi:hypothetical protein
MALRVCFSWFKNFVNWFHKEIIMSFNFKVEKVLGAISNPDNQGWSKELTLVSWNGGKATFDVRKWSPDHTEMSKGITLTLEEAKELAELIALL